MTQREKPAVVFDCMVYLQAAVSTKGPAAAALNMLEAAMFSLYVSEDILREVRDVLTRPKLRQKKRNLTEERVDALMQRLSQKAVLVKNVPKQFAYDRDPDDEPYINLAIAAGAKYLVTRDKDLLDLGNDPDFHLRFPDLEIIDPVEFLNAMSSEAGPEEGTGKGDNPVKE